MFVDTHAHIYSEEFGNHTFEMVQRAYDQGVKNIFMPNIDEGSIHLMNELADRYDFCYPMIGIHPCYIKSEYMPQLHVVEKSLSERKYYAIGEIGIDLYWDKTLIEQQIDAFNRQIDIALDCNLPIVIHSRESIDITIDCVSKKQNGNLKGIFHCFTGSIQQGQKIQDLGFSMGIGGVITYKNAKMDEVLPALNMSNMVLETDAPYLSPVPHRGKVNEPSYIPIIANRLSQIMDISIEDVAQCTTNNSLKLFNIIH